ncbi:pilus assembly protein [Pseudothauera nasutitermitis]|uniref:Pilus assembly protein n=1 Tax=Pseudothauera nasutitermitis TaxID=2565930 RepID=A0A4S4AX19_9RHOO|nr:TadE family protein [Pseudothauera nasutitermitis]THF64574.1 pilus assembly protein [Pseudothauera nasutitermitis]
MKRLGRSWRQRGAAMIEFIVVGPVLTLLGLASMQYGLLFFQKNHLNHATFMAARAGSVAHADLGQIRMALVRALVPMHGGGGSTAELAASHARAQTEVSQYSRLELLNPTRESFDDWNSAELEEKYGRRAIPNANLAASDPTQVGASSGQSLHDANLLKLRITYGYRPGVPLVGPIYRRYLAWLDTGEDAFKSGLIEAGRIPLVMHVTVRMHSDALEPDDPVSMPGAGNGGTPTDPGSPPVVDTPPPVCVTIGCTVEGGGGGNDGGGEDADETPPSCNPYTDPFGCRPIGCRSGDPTCDPACQNTCCTSANPPISWLP